MSDIKIHESKGKKVTRTFIKIPYEAFAEVLKKDGEAFLEDTENDPLKRQTVWKAAKKLSEMVGKKVTYKAGLLDIEEDKVLSGYLFTVED
uniref:Uncharacterized protein n=1 Tax=viral metagenome TaxID=1070528 RepID=A0A6M3M1L3_9ZZZZ